MKIFRILPLLFAVLALAPVRPASAVPTLQLYSEGAEYNSDTQSWMVYDDPFTLQVLGASQPNSLKYVDQVMLYFAVPAEYFKPGGTISIEGIGSGLEHGPFAPRLFTASQFVRGVPSALGGNSGNARTHSIYKDAYYVSVPLENLDVRKTPADKIVNYVDIAKGLSPGTDTGDIDRYRITYNDFFLIHMDLTGMAHYENSRKDGMIFAPFSHDADAPAPSPPAVPEPGTLLLTGLGLIGMLGASRKLLS